MVGAFQTLGLADRTSRLAQRRRIDERKLSLSSPWGSDRLINPWAESLQQNHIGHSVALKNWRTIGVMLPKGRTMGIPFLEGHSQPAVSLATEVQRLLPSMSEKIQCLTSKGYRLCRRPDPASHSTVLHPRVGLCPLSQQTAQ